MELVLSREYGLNCIEFLIKSAVQNFGRDYQFMFLGSLGFKFTFSNNNDIELSSNESTSEVMLEKYHGIKVEYQNFNNFDDYICFIKMSLLRKMPVILYADNYWVPWAVDDFQIRHWQHALLATDIMESGFFCYDYACLNGNIIPYNHLKECYGLVGSFSLSDTPSLDIDGLIFDLNSILKQKYTNETTMQMYCLRNYIGNTGGILDLLYDPHNPGISTIMPNINRISQCRYQFSLSLEHLGQITGIVSFSKLAQHFREIAALWKMIWGLLRKGSITKNYDLVSKVTQKLDSIIDSELKLVENLLSIAETHPYNECVGIKRIANQHHVAPLSNQHTAIEYIPLTKHLNHKAFGFIDNPMGASFEQGYLLIDNEILSGEINTAYYSFNLANVNGSCYDNISCSNQRISVGVICNCIMLMGSSELGPQKDVLDIKSDNEILKMDIAFTQCIYSIPAFDDHIVWHGSEVVQSSNGRATHPISRYIFANKLILPYKMRVDSITLPYCPNMHIFAISTSII